MNPRIFGWYCIGFLAFMVTGALVATIFSPSLPRAETVDQLLIQLAQGGLRQATNLVVSMVLVLGVGMLFCGLHALYQKALPALSTLAMLCLGIWMTSMVLMTSMRLTTMNALAQLHTLEAYRPTVDLILKQHLASGLHFASPTQLTGTLMGVPILVYAWALRKEGRLLQTAAVFLALAGVVTLLDIPTVVLRTPFMRVLSIVPGPALLLAILFMGLGFLRRPQPSH